MTPATFSQSGFNRVPRAFGLWYGLLAPPIVWIAQSLGSVWVTTQACHHPRGPGSARPIVLGLSVGALLIVVSALVASARARRQLRGSVGERRDMMALGGIFLAVTLGLGALFAGLPALLLGEICEATR